MGNFDIAKEMNGLVGKIRTASTCSCNVQRLPSKLYRLLGPCRNVGGFQKPFNPWKMPHVKVNALRIAIYYLGKTQNVAMVNCAKRLVYAIMNLK